MTRFEPPSDTELLDSWKAATDRANTLAVRIVLAKTALRKGASRDDVTAILEGKQPDESR